MRLAVSSFFPAFKESRYRDGKLQVQLAKEAGALMPEFTTIRDDLAWQVKNNGLRNSLLIAIAPTATIASISGCYEAIEPQISNFFKRETLSGGFLNINRYLIQRSQAIGTMEFRYAE
jgi:ribonucleoside-diphosphate reductase alpha chain